MKRYERYKIVILVLSAVVIVESALLMQVWRGRTRKVPELAVAIKGKIAIVVDDWGYNLNNLHILEEIKYPLSLSVLPNLPYSRHLAEKLGRRGFEIILHLPMEPYERVRLEEDTIMTSMDEPAIVNIIDRDLAGAPYICGVSNHMGSKATGDSKTVSIIFRELKKRGLYFLDSFVSAKSICADVAGKMQLSFARRDIFLDNKDNPVYIRKQIQKLKAKANIYGQAIGIGHNRKATLEALKEIMPIIEKEGYKFVFISELVR
ncbi:MAG: divergent polysaccharide deacetylase family protein [Candidatus Omnitrophica bacterium]|nr:divergent polysaccharide deacetylase family protein [Candidatus Omnitrophota bacterium]MCG2706905.1 divergent polysaccharide deacetylase family protein [Candidatus Omnitrophota bacterium]